MAIRWQITTVCLAWWSGACHWAIADTPSDPHVGPAVASPADASVRTALRRELEGNNVERHALLQHVLAQAPDHPQAHWHIGDIKIDLARAQVPEGETVIDLRAVIGDIDVWAPPDLPVVLEVQCGIVSVHAYGRKEDVFLRLYTETPVDYLIAPRRVRVRANLVLGDFNLSRAG